MRSTPELSLQQVQHVAALARLALSEDELAAIGKDLKAILHHVDRLSEVDVSGVEPMTSPHSHCSRLHSDVPQPPLSGETVRSMAPDREGDFIAVPKVLDGGGAA
ncbi:MAG: Asp-tRNA(Asn)/Glu-tRNA(Gln) amidotransferase subunit GatC [Phycisphaerales bacterium]|jgi:aspartyl-tRNA(Asn)/glutamyl-tRNA(Gln) amidotransferase subunit C|nr:Asp-tRNA(Asn)/Glu-tRNA(Gln) amidotransferase subunit GatC [Phycisphaerales bacterium]